MASLTPAASGHQCSIHDCLLTHKSLLSVPGRSTIAFTLADGTNNEKALTDQETWERVVSGCHPLHIHTSPTVHTRRRLEVLALTNELDLASHDFFRLMT
jgi:hypothetical protein